MARIQLTDTGMDIVVKMCDGNPGAMTVLIELMQKKDFPSILSLDSHEIYGTDIYVLWNDICNRNLDHLRAVLMASHMGFIDRSVVTDACSRQDYSGKAMIPVEELYERVVSEMPDFFDDYTLEVEAPEGDE